MSLVEDLHKMIQEAPTVYDEPIEQVAQVALDRLRPHYDRFQGIPTLSPDIVQPDFNEFV